MTHEVRNPQLITSSVAHTISVFFFLESFSLATFFLILYLRFSGSFLRRLFVSFSFSEFLPLFYCCLFSLARFFCVLLMHSIVGLVHAGHIVFHYFFPNLFA
jgi:hypothetical protein